MGAGFAGTGSLTYQQAVDFKFSGGIFLLDLLSNSALGSGFDSAMFNININNQLFSSETFSDLASADAYFSNNFIPLTLVAGPNDIRLFLTETMSSGEGFTITYAAADTSSAPLPGTLPLFVSGLGALGLLVWRRKRRSTLRSQ
jgi:hypothetical protein